MCVDVCVRMWLRYTRIAQGRDWFVPESCAAITAAFVIPPHHHPPLLSLSVSHTHTHTHTHTHISGLSGLLWGLLWGLLGLKGLTIHSSVIDIDR